MSEVDVHLQRHPFLQGMSAEHHAKLACLGRYAEFTAHQVLFAEGDERHELYLLITGRVALEMMAEGRALRVDTLEAGAAFGWSAVLLGGGKLFQARALEPATALVFPGAEVLAACRADTAFGLDLMFRLFEVVSSRLQATRLKVLDTYSPHARKAGA
jgi:CRP-like cAMP-binding protein